MNIHEGELIFQYSVAYRSMSAYKVKQSILQGSHSSGNPVKPGKSPKRFHAWKNHGI